MLKKKLIFHIAKIKKGKYKILNIETDEKSLEEIFLDVVGK